MQPYWRTWLPDRAPREVVKLQKMVDAAPWPKTRYRASLLKQLSDVGYARLVANYWKKNKERWRVTPTHGRNGAPLVVLKKKAEARKLLAGWRERTGVEMWVVANYVNCLSGLRRATLEEVVSTCRAALAGLAHDHCAKYLVHRKAEACALLKDEKELLETWNEYRNYFNAKLEQGEWFEARRKYLLGDLLVLGRALQEKNVKMYKSMRRSLWWKRAFGRPQEARTGGGSENSRWVWVIIWLLIVLSQLLQHH